jgi:hypothetical protein
MPADIQRAKLLLEAGVDAYAQGNFIRAEACFQETKRIAQDSETRNTARLYLATVYITQHIPGVRAEYAAENVEWLAKAEAQFFEILDCDPFASTEQIGAAISGLGSVAVFRRPPKSA